MSHRQSGGINLEKITFLGKSFYCSFLKTDIILNGKYRFMSDSDDPYEVHFMFATCPIVENSRLPLSKQSKEYKGIFCPISRDCKFQECFPKKANVRDSYAI